MLGTGAVEDEGAVGADTGGNLGRRRGRLDGQLLGVVGFRRQVAARASASDRKPKSFHWDAGGPFTLGVAEGAAVDAAGVVDAAGFSG